MADGPKNYLLGYGERLTEKLSAPKMKPSKKHPYTFAEAQKRLAPRVLSVATAVDELPATACPHDEAVAVITLHPSYIAKSHFPGDLLRSVGLEPIGSRPKQIRPDKGAKPAPKKKAGSTADLEQAPLPTSPTSEFFVAGSRTRFREWARTFGRWSTHEQGAEDIIRIEDVYVPAPETRLKPIVSGGDNPLLEVVLHAPDDYVLDGFREYLTTLDLKPDLDRRVQIDGLCFLPVRAPRDRHVELAKFSFLRVARQMPQMRQLRPITRSLSVAGFSCTLPTEGPLSPELRVAVFDGGVPGNAGLKPWVTRRKDPKLGTAVPDCESHGLAVTSALLFGPLENGSPLERPYAPVDHYRVFDAETPDDPDSNYYDILERITSVLRQHKYDFVNLSIGPALPIDDDDVHLWTLTLDQLFADGKTFVAVAAGNTGDLDVASGLARIQAPSDGVNVLGVGASTSRGRQWKRAPYSSLGPGRSPGVVKPDVLAFGGSHNEPFWVLSAGTPGLAEAMLGTSFASPLALRSAVGIRALIGPVVQPIALKALLIHHSRQSDHHIHEVGWGRIPTDLDDLIVCGKGVVHVLYQGELEAGKYLRLQVPVPPQPLVGKIEIAATFCYASEIDPQNPVSYTRAGLEVKFRPDRTRFTVRDGKRAQDPDTAAFFQQKKLYNTEEELRRDAHQWETCLKRAKKFLGSSLNDPVFDVHYNARRDGHGYVSAKPIPYALVVSVSAPRIADIYDRVAQRYRTQLEPLRPVLQVPIRTKAN